MSPLSPALAPAGDITLGLIVLTRAQSHQPVARSVLTTR